MHGIAANATASPRVYSPVTLSNEWPKLERLLLMLLCSCLGTTMNGFFVAAFFVEHTLKKAGKYLLLYILSLTTILEWKPYLGIVTWNVVRTLVRAMICVSLLATAGCVGLKILRFTGLRQLDKACVQQLTNIGR